MLASLVFRLEPVAASRPRFARGGAFYAKPYKNWMDAAMKAIPVGVLVNNKDTPLIAIIETVSTRARTSKLFFPRGDTDNLAKGPLDIITKVGGYYYDDNQIILLVCQKRFARLEEEAHTKVEIYQ